MSSSNLTRILKAIGVSPDTMSLREMSDKVERISYIAICDSDFCCRSFLARKIKKNVPKGTRMCPDCDCALFWKEDK